MKLTSLVFLDEFAAVSNMTRRYARGVRHQRVVDKVPHGHWKVLSTVAAMGIGGMICSSAFDGPINGELFGCFLEQVLVPALIARGPGQVVVMDNLQAHKSQRVAELLAKADAQVMYLPPYSPDFNPIEMAISKIKWWLRKRGARDLLRLDYAIGEAMDLISPSDAMGSLPNADTTLQAIEICSKPPAVGPPDHPPLGPTPPVPLPFFIRVRLHHRC